MLVRGGAYGKLGSGASFLPSCIHVFPRHVFIRESVPLAAAERPSVSESVSEEAEYPPGQASASYAPEPHLTVFMTDYFIPIPVVPP